jgi:hypothetical protein
LLRRLTLFAQFFRSIDLGSRTNEGAATPVMSRQVAITFMELNIGIRSAQLERFERDARDIESGRAPTSPSRLAVMPP